MADTGPNPNVIERTRARLAAVKPQLSILRPEEFCESDTFLDKLVPVALDFISTICASEPSPYQAGLCSQKAETELLRSIRFNSSISLECAIAFGSVALKYVYKNDPNRGIIISGFGRALRQRWNISKDHKDLDDAIYYFEKTIEFEALDEPNRPLHFFDLGIALRQRYALHHNNADFEAAKVAFEEAAANPHEAEPAFLSELGGLLKDKALFLAAEKTSLLEKSLQTLLKAVNSVTPEFKGSMRVIFRRLVETFLELYDISEDDDPAVQLADGLEDAVRPSGNMWMFFYEVGAISNDKFIDDSRPSDAEKSIAFLRAALKESPDNNMVNATLANILYFYGSAVESQGMLTESYQLYEGVINSTGEYDFQLLPHLQSASLALVKRYQLGGKFDDLEKAIALLERGLSSPLIGDGLRWKFRQILAIELGYRFKITEKTEDIEKALSIFKEVLESPKLQVADRAATLNECGKVLFESYKTTRKEEELDQAEALFKTAVDLCGHEDKGIHDNYNELGTVMLERFHNTGRPEHIRQAIDYNLEGLKVLERFPLLLKGQKHMHFTGLGNAFFTKFERWDQVADLNQAIFYYQEAVNNTKITNVRLSTRVGRLAYALQQKFRVTQDKSHLLKSQEYIRTVLDAPNAPLPPQHVAFLNNMYGISYLHVFDKSPDISLFDSAAECFRAAIDSGCIQATYLNPPIANLMRTLVGKYQHTKAQADLQNAVAEMLTIKKLMKNRNYAELRGILDTFGKLCTVIYDTEKAPDFGQLALKSYEAVANDARATAERRIFASLQTARLTYEILNDPAAARQCLRAVISLLPEAILIGPNRGDQLRAAKNLTLLPSFILSFSLAAGDAPEEALRLFEQSRSIIWNRLLDTQTDLSGLYKRHPELAAKFEHAQSQLSRTRPQTIVTEASARMHLNQHELAHQYNDMMRQIRQQEGFEHFMLLDEPSRLLELASQGPIIVLNGTRYRGDAVIVTSKCVSSILLPEFTLENYIEQRARFEAAVATMSKEIDTASSMMTSVLKWLWDAAAGPVLDKLEITGARVDGQKLPRIWWVVNGSINAIPIHAAGDHARAMSTGEPCTVLDRAISSYIPTLRVLDYVRKSAISRSRISADAAGSQLPHSAVLVKMATTLDERDLPNADKEVSAVEDILRPICSRVTVLDRPKRRDVLPLLEASTMAHFACHGMADTDDPSLSMLKLQDWRQYPLDVRTLLRGVGKRLAFVYLSACETAANKVSGLREESVHISGAFQMAGVPYSVGSLWSIEDSVSAKIAGDFYEFLMTSASYAGSDREVLDFGKSAEALHEAVVKARCEGVDSLLWAAFVHSGA